MKRRFAFRTWLVAAGVCAILTLAVPFRQAEAQIFDRLKRGAEKAEKKF